MRSSLLLRVALCLLCVLLLPAAAAPFSNIVFFGDSLSDSGNIHNLTANIYPNAPYFDGRFSNGPVWAETFAALQGLPNSAKPGGMGLGPNFLNLEIPGEGGSNFSIGGARTDTTGAIDSLNIPTGLAWQIFYYLQENRQTADPNALYVLFGGGNDLRDASVLGAADRDAAATAAATNMAYNAFTLAQRGARNFLVMNAPNIGNTPEARLVRNNAAAATAATNTYNTALGFYFNFLPSLLPTVDFHYFDTFSIFELLYQDSLNGGAATGITNATTPCFAGYAGSTGTNCATAMFADDIHPTAITHTYLGYFVHQFLQNSLQGSSLAAASFRGQPMVENPEPASVLLMASGLGLLAVAARRRAARKR